MNYDEINELLNKYAAFKADDSKSSENQQSAKSDSAENNANDDNYRFFYTSENGFGCNDMPGGFQRINPLLFIIIGDIIGDLMAGRLPFNVQNAVGNWIQLVGQAIETYSSQQQYFQSGPGRYYNPKDLNVVNSLCPTSPAYSGGSSQENNSDSNENDGNSDNDEIIKGLCTIINDMNDQLKEVKERMSVIEKNNKQLQ